jgi:L-serine dehydratase
LPVSVLDLFKIGVGPSSSHTVGPMRAAYDFMQALHARHAPGALRRIVVELYGSLSATGRGHGTDRAVIMGLMGQRPDLVQPDDIGPAIALLAESGMLHAAGGVAIAFDMGRDLRFSPLTLKHHPNALRLTALGDDERVLYRNTYYSVGGGFVREAADFEAGRAGADIELPDDFGSAAELLALCAARRCSIADIVAANETAWRGAAATNEAVQAIWQAMQDCVARGLTQEGVLPGGLGVQRRARLLHARLLASAQAGDLISRTFPAMDWVNLYALAVNEENAAGGRVVTAPTNGAAGIIPAVLHYYMRFQPGAGPDDVLRFLLTATAIGSLFKKNASISGAEVGCQGEVGAACAMAAAGLAAVMGATPAQVEHAAEIGLEHNLGLTCDPVGGLVQVPCIERNAIAAIKAINAAQMALFGAGDHRISLDQAIHTLRETGRDMLDKYKETSRGGLAVAYTEC